MIAGADDQGIHLRGVERSLIPPRKARVPDDQLGVKVVSK
jgi:hypothetical protein